MRLRVENLGPLREADVDLSQDLIVLTGPNNTGKTWFAWTVYALMRTAWRTSVPSSAVQSLTPEKPSLILTQEQYEPLAAQLVELATAKVTEDLPGVFAASRRFFEASRLRWTVPVRVTASPSKPANEPGAAIYTTPRGPWLVRGEWHRSQNEMLVEISPLPRTKEDPETDPRDLLSTAAHALSWLCVASRGIRAETTLFPAERLAVNLFARELDASRSELVE